MAIHEVKGGAVQGLGSRNGHRRIHGIAQWGGHRTKGITRTGWTHPDAISAMEEDIAKAEAIVSNDTHN